jgi:hypothetical protein
MKKVLPLVLTFIFFAAMQGFAQQPESQNSNVVGPKIKFEETTFEFGEIEEGTYAKHIFTFTNIGDRPLLLKEVKPACGCTASEWTREPVMPGETGNVTAVFNSRGYGGRTFHKSVTVTTNLNENGQIILFFKGSVTKKVTEPSQEQEQSPVRIENQ